MLLANTWTRPHSELDLDYYADMAGYVKIPQQRSVDYEFDKFTSRIPDAVSEASLSSSISLSMTPTPSTVLATTSLSN